MNEAMQNRHYIILITFLCIISTTYVFSYNNLSKDSIDKINYGIDIGSSFYLYGVDNEFYKGEKYFYEHALIHIKKIRPSLGLNIMLNKINHHTIGMDYRSFKDYNNTILGFTMVGINTIYDFNMHDFNFYYRYIRPFSTKKLRNRNNYRFLYFGGRLLVNYKKIDYFLYSFCEFQYPMNYRHNYNHRLFFVSAQLPLGYKLYIKDFFVDLTLNMQVSGYIDGKYQDTLEKGMYETYNESTNEWSYYNITEEFEGNYSKFVPRQSILPRPYSIEAKIGYIF